MNDNQKGLKLASILLEYPEELEDIREIEREIKHLDSYEIKKLYMKFLNYLKKNKIDDLCKNYVRTFDFNDKTNLHLTYSRHGDNRERGQEIVNLKTNIENKGFVINENELPDYLPLLLEFAAIAPREDSIQVFKEVYDSLKALQLELEKANSDYSYVIKACTLIIDGLMQQDIKGGVL